MWAPKQGLMDMCQLAVDSARRRSFGSPTGHADERTHSVSLPYLSDEFHYFKSMRKPDSECEFERSGGHASRNRDM